MKFQQNGINQTLKIYYNYEIGGYNMKEVWKELYTYLPEIPNGYEVSNFGRVKHPEFRDSIGRIHPERIVKGCPDGKGYLKVQICYRKYKVHKLVAICFLENEDNLKEVDHIDRDLTNNSVSNLRWVTPSKNCRNRSNNRKVECIETGLKFNSCVEAEEYYNINSRKSTGSKVSNAANPNSNHRTAGGYHWKYIED